MRACVSVSCVCRVRARVGRARRTRLLSRRGPCTVFSLSRCWLTFGHAWDVEFGLKTNRWVFEYGGVQRGVHPGATGSAPRMHRHNVKIMCTSSIFPRFGHGLPLGMQGMCLWRRGCLCFFQIRPYRGAVGASVVCCVCAGTDHRAQSNRS